MTADTYWQLADRVERFVLVGLLGLLAYRLVPTSRTSLSISLSGLGNHGHHHGQFRRTANEISRSSADSVIGFAGTLLPLMVVRSDGAVLPYGGMLLLLGFGIAVSAKLSLRRSFGVVAANRGVRTGGLYGLVRHPMYLGYFLTHLGFLLTNPVRWNVGCTRSGRHVSCTGSVPRSVCCPLTRPTWRSHVAYRIASFRSFTSLALHRRPSGLMTTAPFCVSQTVAAGPGRRPPPSRKGRSISVGSRG